MNVESLRTYCLSKPNASEYFPFDGSTLAFRVLDKIFVMIDLDDTDWLVMKCDPDRALDLRDKYANILPAWHMNKKYWNQITQLESFSDDLICALVDHSYDEVVKKFSSRKRLLLNVSSL